MLRRKQIILGSLIVLLASEFAYASGSPPQTQEPTATKDRPLIEVDLHKFADANWNPTNGNTPGARSDLQSISQMALH
jgi:hypothetical protein